MRPDYPLPSFGLAKPLRWEWSQDPTHGRVVRLWNPARDGWSVQSAWTGIVHEQLENGHPFDEIVAAVAQHEATPAEDPLRRRIGTYLFQLRQVGYLDIDFPAPPDPLRPGLRPLGELGRGAVGTVWLANDERRGDVVVKWPWDFFVPLDDAQAALRAEADALAAFGHPGIVPLHDTFERDGLVHLVRGHVPGDILGGTGDETTVRRWARALVDIVAHVHDRGFLLLDLAPGNFVQHAGTGQVVLIDVGAARRLNQGRVALPRPVGSPAFTAPEIRRDKTATPASDAYGLGRLLFTLIAGRPPLASWHASDLVTHLPPGPLAALVVGLSGDDPAERLDLAAVRHVL